MLCLECASIEGKQDFKIVMCSGFPLVQQTNGSLVKYINNSLMNPVGR